MVDLHHHLLFGMDDGAKDLAVSLDMARVAVADGITHVVCTPHASGKYTFEPELIAERLAMLREALAAEELPLNLSTGCDFHMNYDNVEDALANPRKYTIRQTEYLLIELPDMAISRNLGESLYDLRQAGMTPILTHPERNPTLQRDPERLREWMQAGLLCQVTCQSVTGEMGRPAEKMAHQLLADRWVHFLATDAHDPIRRLPRMSTARAWVARKHGEEYAERLCLTNSMSVWEGQPLPEQDPPRNLFDDEDDDAPRPWWKKIFRR
ncbi:protein-tyrosine phosphatase [Bryocella elongata]|uniref:protein-tyrosine-phosphatase n=1 Tax=Bryocella elongata TaxID=863522 RepID=A0A1H5Z760_9BACT|nr:CpsB/CapC family capsule biosynthesis tyrosine phosphatase [Bryocella elongata]SEG31984.1 protein-tyrosine phosphatase [Bryocella elongata]